MSLLCPSYNRDGVVSAWDGLNSCKGFIMSTSVVHKSESAVETSVEFGAENLLVNARSYANAKRIVDAASGYDSLDDAKAALTDAWHRMESQIDEGGKYTPPIELGFGSDSASVIAETILGRRNSVGATRKAFASMGK